MQTADGGMVTDFEAYNMPPIDMLLLPVYPIWVLGHGVPTHSVFNTSEYLPDPYLCPFAFLGTKYLLTQH